MNKILLAFAMVTLAACGTANQKTSNLSSTKDAVASVKLSGKKYCRMASTGGMFGQPAGQREHCITFSNTQTVTDNGSTFFGNPPESGTYKVKGQIVTLTLKGIRTSYKQTYKLSADGKSLSGQAGMVLTLKVENDLVNKEFCRMVPTGGMFGQPAGQGEHCVKFIDGQNVTDNSSTFFGNPPVNGTYSVNGQVISLTLKGVTGSTYNDTYTLSADGKSITNGARAVLNLK